MTVIGWLSGTLRAKHPPQLLLDVSGVGYELEAPMTTFYDLPGVGEEVTLFTHLAVREDAHTLYAFAKLSDRDLFRSLLRVNGVGAKLALTILSGMDGPSFARCVQESDTAALVRLPGVGKKTAERLIIELRDRLDAVGAGGLLVLLVVGVHEAHDDLTVRCRGVLGEEVAHLTLRRVGSTNRTEQLQDLWDSLVHTGPDGQRFQKRFQLYGQLYP